MKLTLGQIADWIHAEGDFTTNREALGYSIDSRTISAGDLFFAVTGDRVDGHDYVPSALANGAVAAVVSRHWLAPDDLDPCRLLRVPESEDCVLRALQTLARRVRRAWGGRVIGVTGSAGKTTTKEAIAAVLEARFRVLKSAGNLNNHFGLPLQLLKLEPEHQVAVIEMGMNHAGEIRALAQIAEPDWAVITNVAPVHIEHFPNGIAGVAAAKRELVEALPPHGIAFLNADDDLVLQFADGLGDRAVLYGINPQAQVRAQTVEELGADGLNFDLHADNLSAPAHLHLLGRHNVLNALAAVAVGLRSGLTLTECAKALSALRPASKRGEILTWRGVRLINDCYNSNPRALDAMVEALLAIPARRHIVVAGEMLELGGDGPSLHRACGTNIAQRGVNILVGVRGLASQIVDAARAAGLHEAIFVDTPEQAGAWLQTNLHPRDAVLLKASRGVRLEEALRALTL